MQSLRTQTSHIDFHLSKNNVTLVIGKNKKFGYGANFIVKYAIYQYRLLALLKF